jgi:hypothetical protein
VHGRGRKENTQVRNYKLIEAIFLIEWRFAGRGNEKGRKDSTIGRYREEEGRNGEREMIMCNQKHAYT